MRARAITMLLTAATLGISVLALIQARLPDPLLPPAPYTPLAQTLALLLAAWLVSRGIDRQVHGIKHAPTGWQRRLRERLGVTEGARVPEADWMAILLHLAIWVTLPLVALRFWGLSEQSMTLLTKIAWTGFAIGETRIVPARIMLGLLALVALVIVIRWLIHRLEYSWLARTPLEAHTREVVATITGYVALAVAALVALSYAGLDLSRLALVAGALSVGIGFGLQNIVNNFVSGLILLFERPIRTGNFISVGQTEGFVRRVRIRATEIETPDRRSVIVPNSELLTNHVQNWDLRDRYARVICPVGVAYGSDTKKVEALLLQVAEAHEEVIDSATSELLKPLALFRGFGDSTLDFELRCFVRDVVRRFVIVSDLNFAIDAAFREQDIVIAFPQRDVWFRNPLTMAQPSETE